MTTSANHYSYKKTAFTILVILQPLLLGLVIIPLENIFVTIPRMSLAVIYFSIAPGLPLALLLQLDDTEGLGFLLYTIGLSFGVIMGVGLLMNLFYPYIGIEKPMTLYTLVITFFLVISLLTIAVGFFRSEIRVIGSIRLKEVLSPVPVGLLNLPFLAIIGITITNHTGNSVLLLLIFIILSIVPLAFMLYSNYKKWYSLALFVVSLSVLYPHTLWKGSYPQESWMPAVIPDLGYWYPVLKTGAEQEGILPESLLFPVFSIIGGINPMLELKIINPLIISITPVAVFLIYQRYLSSQPAFLGAVLTLFVHNYYYDRWGFGTRDAIASVFLVLFILIIFDEGIHHKSRKMVATVFLICAIVSHWGVAFITIGVLSMSVVLYYLGNQMESFTLSKKQKITIPLLLLAYIITFSWYTFTGGGGKTDHLISNILTLFLDPTFSDPRAGPSARAIQLETSLSTVLLKIIYIVLTGLMGIGIVQAILQRFRNGSARVDVEYLILSSSFLMVLGATFLPLGAFYETGRVLSIVYPITGLFAILGLWWFGDYVRNCVNNLTDWKITKEQILSTSQYIFVILLMLLFLLGTGVIAEFSSADYGQSVILSDDDLKSSDDPKFQWTAADCYSCDGQALVWLSTNYQPGYDTTSDHQHNWARYYGFTLATETSIPPWVFLAEDYPLLDENQEHLNSYRNGIPSDTYVFLHSKNHRTNHYLLGQWGRQLDRELEPLETVPVDNSNEIYTNGNSTVHVSESEEN